MLQQMRKFAKSWVASIFLGVLALSFGVWGIADIFRTQADTSVATVGDQKIDQQQFQQEYQTMMRNQSARLGTQLTPEQARAMGLADQTLQRMISRVAVDHVVQRLGLTATDQAVASQIRVMPAFQGPSGSFDHQTFLRLISQSGYTEQSFIDAVRSDTARAQLLTATSNGLQMAPGYAKALFDYLNEVRAVHYVHIPESAAPDVAKPSDAELEAYVKAHAGRFSTPEYRELTYAAITPADLANEIKVTDKQLHNEYELNKAQYQVPEKRTVEQITFPDQKAAEAGAKKIAGGMSFEDLATSRGMSADDIKLGQVAEADLGAERGKAAFALKQGEVSKPVKGTFGWVLLKVSAITPGTNKSFEDVKADLIKEARQKLAAEKISDIVNKFEDAMAGGDTLTQAAQASGMRAVHVKAVDKQGLTPDGKKADIPEKPEFIKQVFAAEIGTAGDPFQTDDGSAFALKVDGVSPPKLRPLDAVRDAAAKEWLADKRQKAMLAKAEALTKQANDAKSLAPVAKTLDAKVEESGALQRGQKTDVFPADLIGQIFDAAPGTAVFGKTDSGYIVARVTGVAHPPAALMQSPQYKQFTAQLSNQIGEDIPTSFAMAARQNQGVSVNKKNFDSVTGAGS